MTPVEPCRLVLQGSFCYLCRKIIIMFTVIGIMFGGIAIGPVAQSGAFAKDR